MTYYRYIIHQMRTTFLFFVSVLSLLFICIDILVNKQLHSIPLLTLLAYEFSSLITKFYFILPFLFFLATLTVCGFLAHRHEFLVLVTGGISKRQILSPLLKFAVSVMFCLYITEAWIAPYLHRYISSITQTYVNPKSETTVAALTLPHDGTQLIYGNYDALHHCLNDVYWIENHHTLWHLKSLDLASATASFVDRLEKTSKNWNIKESFTSYHSPSWIVDAQALHSELLPPQSLPLLQLWKKVNFSGKPMPDAIAKLTAHFYIQLTAPLACLFAVLLPVPFFFYFERQTPLYMLFFWSLFGALCYLVLMNVAFILGSRQVLPPSLALLLPVGCVTLLSIGNYARLE